MEVTGAAERVSDPNGQELVIRRGGLQARLAAGAADLERVRALRDQAFPALAGEADVFDSLSDHLMIEGAEGELLLCLRLFQLRAAPDWQQCYSAAFYDLTPLAELPGAALEIGRLSLATDAPRSWEALRLAWAALLRLGEAAGAVRIFGCASFPGADPEPHLTAFAALRLAVATPERQPKRRAAEICAWPEASRGRTADPAGLPALLRFYLSLGGQVSDHAVIDRQLDTLHVFTLVEAAEMPAARARALRATARA